MKERPATADRIEPQPRVSRGVRPRGARRAVDYPEAPEITLVAPVYNEVENLRPLHRRVVEAFQLVLRWELILADDGSTDGSKELIETLAAEDSRVHGVFLPRNCGQTSALAAGIRAARAPLIATLDADLQNDPADLLALYRVLGDHDAVVGYRVRRNDNWLRRKSSAIANFVRNKMTGDSIRDTGCSLKLFRSDAIRSIPLFEGMHRFLPTLLRWHGFEVVEHPVSHHPRTRGVSKYGVRNRILRASRDLMAVRWMRSRLIPADQERARSRTR